MEPNKLRAWAKISLISSTTAGIPLLTYLVNGDEAAMADPQFPLHLMLILLAIIVAWFASAVVVFLGDCLEEPIVRTCFFISAVSLASVVLVVLASIISGDQSNGALAPKFFNQSGHVTWGCGSESSSMYASTNRGVGLCCYNSYCYKLPTMNFTVVCV